MKKLTRILSLTIALCISTLVGVACEQTSELPDQNSSHIHSYVKKVNFARYKKSDATCLEKALYYYSCECGEAGEGTFEVGEVSGHIYVGGKCKWCNKTKNQESNSNDTTPSEHTHVFNKKITTSDYIKIEATCTKRAVYYYSCACGVVGEEIFSWGNYSEHDYSSTITKQSTCMQSGIKTFICKGCNDSYTETFTLKSFTAEEIHNKTITSVCEINTYDKSGSGLALGTGFIYKANGQVITNYHVIEEAFSAKVAINNVKYSVEKVLAYDKDIDLAVLQISKTGLTPLSICEKTHPVGQEVYAIGSSKGLTNTFSKGIITNAKRTLEGVDYVQHDAAISSGNSGGPLVNSYGEVIGINTMTIKESQNLNFAISVTEISNLNFNYPKTLSQIYEQEFGVQETDTFSKLKNYAVSNGTYDSAERQYRVTLGSDYSSDYTTKYTRYLVYNVTENEIDIQLYAYSKNLSYLVGFVVDEVDGTYIWAYADSYGYTMAGTLYATSFTDNTLLTYTVNNISSYSIRSTVRELASICIANQCYNIDRDLSRAGVTAMDLGFIYF